MTPLQAAAEYGAQYALFTKDGVTPLMYYRWSATRYNDGTVGVRLQYLSYANLWCGSGHPHPDPFTQNTLLPIPGADMTFRIDSLSGLPHPTEEEIQAALSQYPNA